MSQIALKHLVEQHVAMNEQHSLALQTLETRNYEQVQCRVRCDTVNVLGGVSLGEGASSLEEEIPANATPLLSITSLNEFGENNGRVVRGGDE